MGGGLLEEGGFGFVDFDGVLFPGLVEVYLFKGVHQLRYG
jgi:hypothetical protein